MRYLLEHEDGCCELVEHKNVNGRDDLYLSLYEAQEIEYISKVTRLNDNGTWEDITKEAAKAYYAGEFNDGNQRACEGYPFIRDSLSYHDIQQIEQEARNEEHNSFAEHSVANTQQYGRL